MIRTFGSVQGVTAQPPGMALGLGKYNIGDLITDINLTLSAAAGAEQIGKYLTPTSSRLVTTDTAGNVYTYDGYYTVTKLDSNLNQICQNTAIGGSGQGSDIFADDKYVYVTIGYDTGKTVICLKQADLTEAWSLTDKTFAFGVISDGANVFVGYGASGTGGIRKLNRDTGAQVWYNTDYTNIYGVAVDSTYVYGTVNNSSAGVAVHKVNKSTGVATANLATQDSSDYYTRVVAIDKLGNVYAAPNNGGTIKFNSSGVIVYRIAINNATTGLALDYANNLFGGDINTLRKYDTSTGLLIWSVSKAILNGDTPNNICMAGNYDIWVVFNPTGPSGKTVRKINGYNTYQINS